RDSRWGNTDVFALDVVGEGDGRLARVGFGFRANLQRPVHHDPLGGQLQILVIREAERAVQLEAMQRRRTDVEDNVHVLRNGDHVVLGGHLLVRPGGRIRPAAGRRRSSTLSLNDSEYADEQDYWQERRKKERAMLRTHGINPPYSKMTENRSGKAERDPA